VYRDDIGENEKPIMKTVPDGQSFLTIRPKLALSEQVGQASLALVQSRLLNCLLRSKVGLLFCPFSNRCY